MTPCNPGSYGHPSLCARPCIYIAKNGCCHVEGCNFCHMTHATKTFKLNQRQRFVLQELDRNLKVQLLLLAMREGFAREGLVKEGGKVIRLLELEASRHPQQEGLRGQRKQMHDLRKAFTRMASWLSSGCLSGPVSVLKL